MDAARPAMPCVSAEPHAASGRFAAAGEPPAARAPGEGRREPSDSIETETAECVPSSAGDDWRRELQQSVRTAEWLVERLGLPRSVLPRSDYGFPIVVTDSFLRRMRPGDPRDPLLLQILPRDQEGQTVGGYEADPLQELGSRPVPGVIHKYRGRVLLVLTGLCAVHCRYCFRREYPYEQEPRSLAQWQPAIDYVAARREIHEVILSGGDPLVWSDRRLSELLGRLAEVPHLTRVRIHSRLPVVLPSRITDGLLDVLTSSRLQAWMVIHANHARELQADCADALQRLRQAGLPLLNQAVLLRGINDSVEALAGLAERLGELGIAFYYLHQLDRVRGAAHFEVSEAEARELVDRLRERVSGFLVPRLVRETPREPAKTPLA